MLIHSSWFIHCCKEVTNIVIAIKNGRIVLSDTSSALLENDKVRQAYLGE